jgi:peptidoglycan/LPS O-acetylase OafA/YrhL
VPLVGGFMIQWVVYLTFLFLAGAVMEMYRERIPISDGLGVVAGIVFLGTLLTGGFFVFGFPAFAYLLVWLSLRLPKRLHWVGRRNDYSYGIYIYGFVGQQTLASFGMNRWGFLPFVAMSFAVAWIAAFLSWHLVEKRMLALKEWTPNVSLLRLLSLTRHRRPVGESAAPEPAAAEASTGSEKAAVAADQSDAPAASGPNGGHTHRGQRTVASPAVDAGTP